MDLQEALLDRQQKQREDNERRGVHARSPTSGMKYGAQPSGVQAAAAVQCEGTGKIAWEVGAEDACKALASELEVQNMLCLSLFVVQDMLSSLSLLQNMLCRLSPFSKKSSPPLLL